MNFFTWLPVILVLLFPICNLYARVLERNQPSQNSEFTTASNTIQKKTELDALDNKLFIIKQQVNNVNRLRSTDFLQLLPSISMSRRTTSEMITDSGSETYIGFSVNSSQLWNISDRYKTRDAAISSSLLKIGSCSFLIRKIIERKYLFKDRLWKFQQIRSSLSNPVEMAAMDEKIDEITVKIQECEIEIEKAYAEMDYAAGQVER